MKFRVRFADQIVGFFVVLSLIALAFVVIMLGRSQRWFAKDQTFTTTLQSATGLSKNMAVLYRGFTIGSIKDFYLNEDDGVEVIFIIQEEYTNRVRLGSMVEMMVNPIGLGNSFFFHPGRGEELPGGSFIPELGTAQARELIRQRLAVSPQRDDSISLMMSRANTTLEHVNRFLAQLNPAIGRGTESTEIGQIIGSVRKILGNAEEIPSEVSQLIAELREELKPILSNLTALTNELNEPGGLLYSVMDTDKEVYTSLVNSLVSLSNMLDSLDKTTAILPGQMPVLLTELRAALKTADDVLVSLTNNPILKRGVPDRLEGRGRGTNPRNIRF